MTLFPRWNRSNGINQDLLLRIRRELEEAYSRPESERYFIHHEDAYAILARDRVGDLFRNLPWYKEDYRDQLWGYMPLIICILITINFDDWGNFETLFFAPGRSSKHLIRKDTDLPFEDEKILFLNPENIRESFRRQQYVFLPIIIEKDTHKEYSIKQRLPIMKVEKIDTSGAQGDVDRVTIERRFLKTDTDHNFQQRVMARKTITTGTRRGQHNFQTEKHNLEQFKKSLINHSHIMQSFATFVHGSKFVILSDWADGRDLHEFLYNPDKTDHYAERSIRFTPHNLLTEAYSLAQALQFLHTGMRTNRGAHISCAHLDLKPENVLVCFPSGLNSPENPVGLWKIGDFGLSNVEETVVGSRLVVMPPSSVPAEGLAPGTVLRDASIHPPQRGAGPFQPPEVRDSQTARVSTSRDVWSFGCILAMILAFALGGPEEVNKQLQCRSGGPDDYFYHRIRRQDDDDPWTNTEVVELKPEINRWLEQQAASKIEWVSHCADLVRKLLNVDVIRRPSMSRAVADLGMVLQYTELYGTQRLWGFDKSGAAPEVVSSIPYPEPVVTGSLGDAESHYNFVGVRTNSSPSSVPTAASLAGNGSPPISSWFRRDLTSSYLRFAVGRDTQGAAICQTAGAIAFFNSCSIDFYDIKSISDDSNIWTEPSRSGVASNNELSTIPFTQISATRGYALQKVVVAGHYLATIEHKNSSSYLLNLYTLDTSDPTKGYYFSLYASHSYSARPQGTKLSTLGYCLTRVSDVLYVIPRSSPQTSFPIPSSDKDVLGFDFTGDGSAFCLWEQDSKCHYWSVWDTKMKILGGRTITAEYRWSPHPPAPEACLIPARAYPRFVACDKRGNVYVVRADLATDRVHRLGETSNVFTGLMSANDDGFLLVRAKPHSRQGLQKIDMNSMSGVTTFRPYDLGRLPRDLDKDRCGIAVRPYMTESGRSCLISVFPSGILTRKVL